MIRSSRVFPLAIIALTIAGTACRSRHASEPTNLSWSGPLAAGRTVHVRDVNGSVKIERATGANVEVSGIKRWERGNPNDARMEVVNRGGDVTVCATWGNNRCGDRSSSSHRRFHFPSFSFWHRRSDVQVDFVVRVPDGVRVDAQNVNGDVDITGASADVQATTVLGSIHASVPGASALRATTVTGEIVAHLDALPRDGGDIRLEAVTGEVVAELPADANADVDASTVAGSFKWDFPLQTSGAMNPRHVHGTIGSSGRQLTFKTVAGDVSIRRNAVASPVAAAPPASTPSVAPPPPIPAQR